MTSRLHLLPGLALCALVLAAGCRTVLRIRGSGPTEPRPELQEVALPGREYRVWVVVPSLTVSTYPLRGKTQQPMLQFTGDLSRLKLGSGHLAVLVAPDLYRDGQEVTYFADKVLWTDRLDEHDRRTFSLWLRENNRTAPTRYDEKLKTVEQVAQVVEDLSGLAGIKVPARKVVNVSAEAFKELQQDWLILRWSCPWGHVLRAARAKMDSAKTQEVVLRARLLSREQVRGQPVARIDVLFVVRQILGPLPAGLRGP